ncbi:MAG TPA: integrase, partial [Quisquiliibacterium sp.]|nr:integrase [Quisquiliibacterium sp.]
MHADLLPGFKNAKHGDQWINTLATYAFPKIGPRPVGEIDVAAVLDVLRPIWNAKEETARRVRQRMDAVMRWAVAHGYATTNPVDAASELLGKQRDKVEHHTAMPLDQIPDFYARLGRSTGMAARCLQFLV